MRPATAASVQSQHVVAALMRGMTARPNRGQFAVYFQPVHRHLERTRIGAATSATVRSCVLAC